MSKKYYEQPAAVAKTQEQHNFYLCVLSFFRDYKKGALIHDPEEINKILSCAESNMTNKVNKRS